MAKASYQRQLQITIEANDRHCQSAPGVSCQFLKPGIPLARRDAAVAACLLFPILVSGVVEIGCEGSEPWTELVVENGWPVRCDECLRMEAAHG